ncbi:MAG: IS21 family transposase [Myxococcaceae bacterium]|nr:IS21 family transposase [Myxococcaceae bacterium]MCI0674047.1 IS21 family transposase [Myxococcaceae bacterium]
MIPPDVRARIRRLYNAEQWPVGTIATELGVHHSTVTGALEDALVASLDTSTVRPTVLGPYTDFIDATLKAHPRLRATRLFHMVKARGYPGGYEQVKRYVRRTRPQPTAEAFLRRTTLPGEEAQVDWGSFGKVQVGRASRTLSCFVLVLGHSRAMYACFFLGQTMECFLEGHVRAFEALGGVPRALLYDNLKSVVLERAGDAIRFHPRLLEAAGHYHFAPKPCAPYRGNEKGKVERAIRYLRDSFFAARSFHGLDDLNRQLQRWVDEVAHQRRVPGDASGRTVKEALEAERPRLLPLPAHPLPIDALQPVSSGKTPYVRFDGNDYSIPDALVRQPLTLVASTTTVRLLHGQDEVARHVRSWDKGETVEDEAHLSELARKKARAHELRGRDLLRARCRNADRMLEALAARGDNLGNHTVKLLALADRYGAAELDAALAEALARGALGPASVAHLLEQRARQRGAPPPLPLVLPDDPRVREQRVSQHSLTPYDALLKGEKDDDS